MRLIGILAKNSAEARLISHLMLRSSENESPGQLLSAPKTPQLITLAAPHQVPALQCKTHANGSLGILDGELYNTEELAGANTRRYQNDVDVLLSLYLEEGDSGIGKADMAATLTIWDALQERLLVYRDRIGRVSGYYLVFRDALLWSSHIQALLRTDSPWSIDEVALDAFLACGYTPAPWTLVKGIKKIPPGHVLTCGLDRSLAVRSFWRHRTTAKRCVRSDHFSRRLGPLLTTSLCRHYAANRNIGVLLSGGVDSKLVVAGLTKLLGVPGQSIPTFTFHYTDYEGRFNELKLAQQAAEYFGTRHHEIHFRPQTIPGNLDLMLRHFEEPFTYGLHTFMLADVAKADARVLLTGTGIDSWYLDSIDHYALKYRQLAATLAWPGRAAAGVMWGLSDILSKIPLPSVFRLMSGIARRTDAVVWSITNNLPSYCGPRITPDHIRQQLYVDKGLAAVASRARVNLMKEACAEFVEETDRARFSFTRQRFFTAECAFHWYQASSRAHGLIFRHPFTANDIVELAAYLPRDNVKKHEIRTLAATLMPQELAYAGKVPQSVPIREWLRGPLLEFLRDNLTEKRLGEHGLFDPRVVRRLIHEHLRGQAHHGWILWSIIMVLAWNDLFLAKQGSANRKLWAS